MPKLHLIFDFIIFFGIFASLVISLYIINDFRKKKVVYKKTASVFLGFSLLSLFTLLYGSFIEPNIIVEKHETLELENVTSLVNVALIADYQVGPYRRADFVERSVHKILRTKPDIVLIAGDLIDNNGSKHDELSYLLPLKKLAEEIPTYAVHGNHEHGAMSANIRAARFEDKTDETKNMAEDLGITYLVNQLALLEIRGQQFYIFGSDDWWGGKTDFSPMDKRQPGIPTIVFNHNPAAIREASKYDFDLFVAGHTHGGQIRLPFVGALFRVDTSFPKSWDKGWYEYENIRAYTTSGLGESVTRARLFNFPEIVYFEIK